MIRMLTLKDIERRVVELLRERDRQEQRPKPLSSISAGNLREQGKFLWGDDKLLDPIAGEAYMELDASWYRDLAEFEKEIRERVKHRLSAIYSPEVVSIVLNSACPYELFWFATEDMWEVYEEVEFWAVHDIIDGLEEEEGEDGE